MKKLHMLLIGYVAVLLLLFLYSFTQIDLGLVISRYPLLYQLEKSFQYIGYFNRPLSGSIYLGLIAVLYVFYFLFLFFASKREISGRYIWKVVILAAVILTFSYNAFSYDLFNYIFDAKILTHYHQNPYLQKALDYPGDPMLAFMHWTHRVFPYGPIWLALTVPLSYIGLGFFLPTFFMFKLLIAGSFLGSVYFVGKIFQKIAPEKEHFGLIFFALNPLILIECLVSAHLDIVMMFFVLWAFYLLLNRKYFLSWILLILSVGIKFATGFLLPVFILVSFLQHKRKGLPWTSIFGSSIVLLSLAVIAASLRTNFQPWYLVLIIPFTVFLADRYYVFIPVQIISYAALLTYVPYLYLGNWDKPVPEILSTTYISSYILSLLGVGIYSLVGKLFGFKNVKTSRKSV